MVRNPLARHIALFLLVKAVLIGLGLWWFLGPCRSRAARCLRQLHRGPDRSPHRDPERNLASAFRLDSDCSDFLSSEGVEA